MDLWKVRTKEAAKAKCVAKRHAVKLQRKIAKTLRKGEEPLVLTLSEAVRLTKKGERKALFFKMPHRKSEAYKEAYFETLRGCLGWSRTASVWEYTSKLSHGRQMVKI